MADDDNDQNLKNLRKMAEDGKTAIERAELLERENLFLRAGVDLDHKIGKMLFKTWDGTNLDELRAEAAELGLVGGNNTPATNTRSTTDDADDDEERTNRAEQQRHRQTLTSGKPASANDDTTPDPTDEAFKHFHEDRKNGVRLENAQLAAIDRVLVAASKGDKRVIFDQAAWDRKARSDSASLR